MENSIGIQDILEKAADIAKQEFKDSVRGDWEALKDAAKKFLEATYGPQGIEALQQQRQIKMKNIISANDLPQEYQIKDFTATFIKEKEAAQTFYKNLFAFDIALTKYLGELPKRGVVVMVGDDGAPLTYEMSLGEMAAIAEREGRIQIYDPGKGYSIEEKVDNTDDKNHIEHGRAAFMGVNARLEAFYNKRAKKKVVDKKTQIEKTYDYQRQGGLLMWKHGDDWKMAVIANQGAISEAYVSFLFAKHATEADKLCDVAIGNKNYYNHTLIERFYTNYISKVTNLAAIVEEDVIGEYAQYAVKAKKAALATPAQHLRVAATIASSEMAPDNLKEIIKNAFKQDSQLAPLVNEKIKKVLKNGITKEATKNSLSSVKRKIQSKGWIDIEMTVDDLIEAVKSDIDNLDLTN